MINEYLDHLRSDTKDYDGIHQEIIREAPRLYELANDLIHDSQIDSNTRMKLLASIGYFIIPDDLYPEEEHGAIGYVEDIMLLQHVFVQINNEIGNAPLVRYWKGEPKELAKILKEDFNNLKAAYPDLYLEVVRFVGV